MKKPPQKDRSARALGRRLAKEVPHEELKRVTGAATYSVHDDHICDMDEAYPDV